MRVYGGMYIGRAMRDKGLVVRHCVHAWRGDRSRIGQCTSRVSALCKEPSSATKVSPKGWARWLRSRESVSLISRPEQG